MKWFLELGLGELNSHTGDVVVSTWAVDLGELTDHEKDSVECLVKDIASTFYRNWRDEVWCQFISDSESRTNRDAHLLRAGEAWKSAKQFESDDFVRQVLEGNRGDPQYVLLCALRAANDIRALRNESPSADEDHEYDSAADNESSSASSDEPQRKAIRKGGKRRSLHHVSLIKRMLAAECNPYGSGALSCDGWNRQAGAKTDGAGQKGTVKTRKPLVGRKRNGYGGSAIC